MSLQEELHQSQSVFILPLGGLAEIGMNMMAFIHKGKAIVLDCGVQFPEPNQLGLDLVTPDIEFFDEYKIEVEACVFTHAHEDHVGSIAFLFDALRKPKIYATEFTFGMFEERLKQYSHFDESDFIPIEAGSPFQILDFEFEAFSVTHSMVDCLGFSIKTPVGRIVHTGDFKIDEAPVDGVNFDREALKRFSEDGVLLLMSDSTNVGSEGRTKSESELAQSLEDIILKHKKGKVIVTMFSSNIQRIRSIIQIARKAQRKICPCGRSVSSNIELARRLGFIDLQENEMISPRKVDDENADEVLVIATGTQAEPRSALNRMAHGTHPDLNIEENDLVIFSSRHIPGNEKKIATLMNQLCRLEAKIIDADQAFVHVSGHARKEELKEVMALTQPRFFLPVHGEYRMLVQHAELCRENFPSIHSLVAENGDLLELKAENLKRKGRVASGKSFLDEFRNLIPEALIKERKRMGQNGLVVASLVLNARNGKILRGPDFQILGLPEDVDFVALENEASELMRDLKGSDIETLEDELRILTRRHFRRHLGIKPTVIPIIYET